MITVKEYLQLKKNGYSERERKSLKVVPNSRSSDYIIPNIAYGCDYACTYCATSRNKPFGYPIEKFTNIDAIIKATKQFALTLPPKVPNQCDPKFDVFEIGEACDCLGPSIINTTNKLIEELVQVPNIKTTFATKAGSPSRIAKLIDCPIPYKGRIRASLMPQAIADIVEIGTAKIKDRLLGLNLAYSKNWEIHLNFSPVILYKGWVEDYIDLFKLVDSTLTNEVKNQLKGEIIFLTHHKSLSELNMEWNPEAEKLLWRPEAQEYKTNERGSSDIVRYKALSIKKLAINKFRSLIKEWLPFMQIRYIF